VWAWHAVLGAPYAGCVWGFCFQTLSFDRLPSGCERGGRLLKFNVCWDPAVCAVSAGGFFSVWKAVRKGNGWRPVLSA